jgi:aminoglycoside phosphotransferase (APT) family kinase protein
MGDHARWLRPAPRFDLGLPFLQRMAQFAFPRCQITQVEPLTDGYRNANFKLQIDRAAEPVVLRIYEHDPSLCAKELDVMRLVSSSVPLPQVIHAELRGFEDLPPFMLTRYVEGITFRELRRRGDLDAVAQAAFSVGETLAAIGRFVFPRAGWLGPELAIETEIEGAHEVVEPRLVHGDFSKRNLMVAPVKGRWSVAAVLDWEFAFSGPPLTDIGSFLRYERTASPLAEPHFSAGYVSAGGELPPEWRRQAKITDLKALRRSLTHEDLPNAIREEIVELIRATVEDRDPDFPPNSEHDSARVDECDG